MLRTADLRPCLGRYVPLQHGDYSQCWVYATWLSDITMAGLSPASTCRLSWTRYTLNLTYSKIGVDVLVNFCMMIRSQYPTAKKIYVIRDNWPVHNHPKVLQAAVENNIHFVPLPTYAPWTNPIEKLWRWLYQDILHLHRHADQWDFLKQLVNTFLKRFENESEDLLRYVGLSNGKIPAAPVDWNECTCSDKHPISNENMMAQTVQQQIVLPN